MNPSTAITRMDLSLGYSEVSLAAMRRGFIGLQVLPAVGVGLQAATFRKIEIAGLVNKVETTLRNPCTAYSEKTAEWTTDSFATEDHGVVEPLDDRTIRMYPEIQAEQIAVERAIHRLLQAYEREVAEAIFNATTWTSYKTAAAVAWTTKATAVPITDIDGAIESCIGQCGARPNTLILSDYALNKLVRSDQVEDLLKYSGRDDPKALNSISGLKTLLGLDNILVGSAFRNTADDGLTPVFGRMWDATLAMVAHVHDSADLEAIVPRVGCTVMWNEENASLPGAGQNEISFLVETNEDWDIRGRKVRVRNDRQIKVLHVKAAHLLTGVTA